MKKVLVIGAGGREHALGWKISQSNQVSEVIYSPGNAGTIEGKGRNISINGTRKENFSKLFNLVESKDIDLIVVGPEIPLSYGIVDFFNHRGYNHIFGPTANASKLESDKFYSHNLMRQLNIPQADSVICYTEEESINAIEKLADKKGVVIKSRGLTQGKGVIVCNSIEQARFEIKNHIKRYGPEVLISKRLFGQEFSIFGISDGIKVSPLEISVQDHKPLLDGDNGPNTGGMGAYCPVPIISDGLIKKISEEIMNPLISKMKSELNEYKGFLYAGMIMTSQGPKVIEFNCRFGDPECQPTMMMFKTDLYKTLSDTLEGRLNDINIKFNTGASCCVVLASKGYPNNYKKGFIINGLDEVGENENVKVFHSGTKLNNGNIITFGGRVLGVTGYSEEGIIQAKQLTYEVVSKLNIPRGFHYRKDIADKAMKDRL